MASYVSVRQEFAHRLDEVRDQVLTLGSMVDKAIDRSIDALGSRNLGVAKKVVRDDQLINQLRFDIEQSALLLMATQQPMASDLRFLASVLHIVTDLERMGDHARSIARLTIKLGDEPPLKPLAELPQMAALSHDRLRGALDALVARDPELAQRIAEQDAGTDRLQDSVYEALLAVMTSDPSTVTRATYLLWVAHNLERVGDHITNICERVIFAVTGHMQELNVHRGDRVSNGVTS
ncbi:MAG: phosphate signaling complex protein PhoU [Chloroflexota bacterium]|nr:phosphate signaling complex protein PhoU [Chloroflexota bacterium]